jgi:hypothetical protein
MAAIRLGLETNDRAFLSRRAVMMVDERIAVAPWRSWADTAAMPGPVETAIRARVVSGAQLPTPTGRATFMVDEVGASGLVLLFGPKRTRTTFSWSCLEGIPDFLRSQGWVRIGADRDVRGDHGALDGYLKGYIKRQTADYIAVILERAGIVELDRALPARVRLLM